MRHVSTPPMPDIFLINPPVRTTVGSVLNGVLVEIDVIAFVGTATSRTEREA